MKITIVHLYDDLMNLYGEYGNVKALKRFLTEAGAEVSLETKSVSDDLDFTAADVIFLGAGTEEKQKIILEHLKKYKDGLFSYLEQGGFALMTGNSFEILGESIIDAKGNLVEGLNFVPFQTKEQNKTRMTGDAVFSFKELELPLVGFVNKCSEIHGNHHPCFTVEMGMGDEEGKKEEGLWQKELMGTHLTGPVLIKNPHFLFYLGKKILEKKAGKIMGQEEERALKENCFFHEFAAYEITLRELRKRME